MMHQHFVPKCYLEAFANEKKEAYTVDVIGLKKGYKIIPQRHHITKICTLENYYDIENNPEAFLQLQGHNKLFIEKVVFGKRESDFNKIRNKLLAGETPEVSDLEFLADFILLLKLRNPFWEDFFVSKQVGYILNQSYAQEIIAELDQKEIYKNIPASWKEAVINTVVEQMRSDQTVQNTLRLSSLINRNDESNESTQQFRATLLNSAWTIWKINDDSTNSFITCDNPGFAIETKTGKLYNSKFTNGFKYFFPVTPKHLLEISDSYQRRGVQLVTYPAPKELISLSNTCSLNFINQYIIGQQPKELNDVIAFIKSNLKTEIQKIK